MSDPVYVEILTAPNCVHSPSALKVAKRVVGKLRDAPVVLREVSLATQEGAERAQEYEVDATPTIAINGRVAYVGVPTIAVMESLLNETLKRQRYQDSYFF